MNKREYLLTCLAEECDEVGQRISKANRFSLEEIQSGQDLNNADRIAEELKDLISVAVICFENGYLPTFLPDNDTIAKKLDRIRSYAEISKGAGTLSEDI